MRAQVVTAAAVAAAAAAVAAAAAAVYLWQSRAEKGDSVEGQAEAEAGAEAEGKKAGKGLLRVRKIGKRLQGIGRRLDALEEEKKIAFQGMRDRERRRRRKAKGQNDSGAGADEAAGSRTQQEQEREQSSKEVSAYYHFASDGTKFKSKWDAYDPDEEIRRLEEEEAAEERRQQGQEPSGPRQELAAIRNQLGAINRDWELCVSALDQVHVEEESVRALRKCIATGATELGERLDSLMQLVKESANPNA